MHKGLGRYAVRGSKAHFKPEPPKKQTNDPQFQFKVLNFAQNNDFE